MRVVALVSGGKDSCHAMLWCRTEGHEIVALANLEPEGVGEQDSMMYQTVGHEAVHLYAEAMDLPLYRRRTAARAVDTDKGYTVAAGDEVEDLHLLLKDVLAAHPDIQAVSSGAILSDYQRVRVENVCARLGLISLSYLWRRNQAELLHEMAASGLHAIFVKVASFGLNRRHLGRSVADLKEELIAMAASHQLNPCGEGGEFETFVLDSPLFRRPLRLIKADEVVHSDDAFSPVSYLRLEVELGPVKDDERGVDILRPQVAADLLRDTPDLIKKALTAPMIEDKEEEDIEEPRFITLWTSGENEEKTFRALEEKLRVQGLSTGHVLYTWVLLPHMSQFATVNKAYASVFPPQHPPCRACVALPVRNLTVACLAVQGSPLSAQNFMHVQSISHWAPANIGPYSQAVALHRWLLVSGQIAMRPADLSLASDVDETLLALRHTQVVISGISPCGPGLAQLAYGVCYGTEREILISAKVCFHKNVCDVTGNCLCQRWCFVQVPGLPKRASVEWQTFMKSGKDNRVKIQTFLDVQLLIEQLSKMEGAVWVICEVSLFEQVREAVPEHCVVMPVISLLESVACIVSL